MNRFNYPISSYLKTDNFWVCDFKQGDVLDVGSGSIDAAIDSVTNRVSTEELPEQFIRLRVE